MRRPAGKAPRHRSLAADRHFTNVRFGFVDTKGAKSPVKPFSISADKAAQLVVRCMRKRPIRFTYPRTTAVLLWFVRWGPRLRVWLS